MDTNPDTTKTQTKISTIAAHIVQPGNLTFAENDLVDHGRAFCIVAIVLFPPYPSVSKSYLGSYLLLYL